MVYTEDWWKEWNSRIIWISIGIMFVITIVSSYDFSKPFPNFALLGQNQFIMGGLITLLLLFRYISKIKIGDFLEIDFNALNAQINRIDTLLSSVRTAAPIPAIDQAKTELQNAKATLALIKAKINY